MAEKRAWLVYYVFNFPWYAFSLYFRVGTFSMKPTYNLKSKHSKNTFMLKTALPHLVLLQNGLQSIFKHRNFAWHQNFAKSFMPTISYPLHLFSRRF